MVLRRKIVNSVMCFMLALCFVVAIYPLFNVFFYVIEQGREALGWEFFTQLPKPIGEKGGGMMHAMLGTLQLILMAAFVGVPVGVLCGVFMSEFRGSKLVGILRFSADLLTSIPSIVVGLSVYSLVVSKMGHFSALAGALALFVIMVPLIARTAEEVLKLVPNHIREAGLALGLPRWKVILRIVLGGSLSAISTGVVLAIARAAGETAPLLFTAFGNNYLSFAWDRPIASLPVQIYTQAISPYPESHRQAWAGAFVLVLLVFLLNLFTRAILGREAKQGR